MSLSSIARAAVDEQLIVRVQAAAHQVIMTDTDKASTVLGKALLTPSGPGFTNPVSSLMWPVAVDTAAAYEYALLGGNGSPGFDVSVITDAAIITSVNDNWPMEYPPSMVMPPAPEPALGTQVGVPENMPDHVTE